MNAEVGQGDRNKALPVSVIQMHLGPDECTFPTHPYVLGTFTVSVDSCKVLPLCSVQQLLGDSSKITTRLLHVIVHFKYLLTSLRHTIAVLLRPSCLYGHMYIIMISCLALFTQKHKMHQLA